MSCPPGIGPSGASAPRTSRPKSSVSAPVRGAWLQEDLNLPVRRSQIPDPPLSRRRPGEGCNFGNGALHDRLATQQVEEDPYPPVAVELLERADEACKGPL